MRRAANVLGKRRRFSPLFAVFGKGAPVGRRFLGSRKNPQRTQHRKRLGNIQKHAVFHRSQKPASDKGNEEPRACVVKKRGAAFGVARSEPLLRKKLGAQRGGERIAAQKPRQKQKKRIGRERKSPTETKKARTVFLRKRAKQPPRKNHHRKKCGQKTAVKALERTKKAFRNKRRKKKDRCRAQKAKENRRTCFCIFRPVFGNFFGHNTKSSS